MLLSLLLVSGCITVDDGLCSNDEYRALNGDCVQDPGPTDIEVDTASEDLDLDSDGDDDGSGDDDGAPDDGGDADSDGTTDADVDAGSDGDSDADSSGDQMIDSVDITCDAGSWYYNISTATETESAAINVTETGDASTPTEFHTLTMAGASSSGGEIYERDLLLVTDYYFEDVATQFACTDGSNENLTWRIELYSDAARTSPIGCVSWGHDTTSDLAAGCQPL